MTAPAPLGHVGPESCRASHCISTQTECIPRGNVIVFANFRPVASVALAAYTTARLSAGDTAKGRLLPSVPSTSDGALMGHEQSTQPQTAGHARHIKSVRLDPAALTVEPEAQPPVHLSGTSRRSARQQWQRARVAAHCDYRKVTGGFRSRWGADLFADIRSVLGTAARRRIDAYQAILAILHGGSVLQAG
jgi:hypothetical protein